MVEGVFAGKRILVTGATGGIGRRVCARLGELGGEVLMVARNAEALARLDCDVNGEASGRRLFPVDFRQLDSTRDCVKALEQLENQLDGVVVIVPSVPKSEAVIPSDEGWLAALELCFVNPLSVMRAGVSKLAAGGRIVIVSGIASVEVFPDLPFANVVRHAWLAEGKRLSLVLAPRRIRVNTCSLGGTLTERFAARVSERRPHDVPSRESPETIPLGEFGDPDDAADVVVSHLGRLSNHITGTNIIFDGGLTRSY